VEAAGVEPASGSAPRTASTCLARPVVSPRPCRTGRMGGASPSGLAERVRAPAFCYPLFGALSPPREKEWRTGHLSLVRQPEQAAGWQLS